MKSYRDFLDSKRQYTQAAGFSATFMPSFLFDFQSILVEWALRRGRSAIFADCGLGKTPMQLVWAENIVRHTGKPVLIVTPIAVGSQTLREAEKFDIECVRSRHGESVQGARIVVTNYEQLHKFDSSVFSGVVCDESSILKNFDGMTKKTVTEFLRTRPYRLLCTATSAPNDYIELGTSSEALGELGYQDMLTRFFKNDQNSNHPNRNFAGANGWRFRGHAEERFWPWVSSWARAVRKPSDLGCEDGAFVLPPLHVNHHTVEARTRPDGYLFSVPASGLREEREIGRRTVRERCERAAEIVSNRHSAISWCHTNIEGDLLQALIPSSVQIAGKDPEEKREEAFLAFTRGDVRVIVTKPKIGGFGLNWQHCARQTFFPTHSYEQFYQSIRRSWRFGQKNPVQIDIVTTTGQKKILENMTRKAAQAEVMFDRIAKAVNFGSGISRTEKDNHSNIEVPLWLQ
jgi:hypothetical protein